MKLLVILMIFFLINGCQNRNTQNVEYKYFSNGSIKSKSIKANRKSLEKYYEYYPSGSLKVEAYYKNNIQDSIQKVFYENGILNQQATFVNGDLLGEAFFYDSLGRLEKKYAYINVRDSSYLNEIISYDTAGSIIKEKSLFFSLTPERDTINLGEVYNLDIKLDACIFKAGMFVIIPYPSINTDDKQDTIWDMDDGLKDFNVRYHTKEYNIGNNIINGAICEVVLFDDKGETKADIRKYYFNQNFFVEGL